MRRPAPLLAAAWLAACTALPALGQDDIDEALGGFDEEAGAEPTPPEPARDGPPEAKPPWDLTGSAGVAASYRPSHDPPSPYHGLTRLQAKLALQLDVELPRDFEMRIAGRGFRDYAYVIAGRSHFTSEALDVHESELEFQELWLEGPLLEDLDLKFGRQIVSWGRSDNLRVLDVLNPIDSREPGLVDVEDLKLPVTMTRLEYFVGSWSLEALAIHETRFDTAPVPGSEFFPADVPSLPPEDRPANGGDDTEWGARLRGIFPGWDVSLHWARYWDDQPYATAPPDTRLEHARVTLLGVSGQVALGDWLVKSEVAHLRGLDATDRTRIDSMAGVEYLGIEEVAIALEVVNRHIRSFDPVPLDPQERNAWEGSLMVTADFLNDRLHATLVAIGFGAHLEDGGLVRAGLAYDLRDALELSGGVVMYQDGERPPLDFWGHADRLYLELKYSF